MVFLALYFVAIFLIMGLSLYPILKKLYPDDDPFIIANGFVFFWFLGDLFIRFFFQKLPVMSVKPLLTLPIKRSKIVNYVLGKSGFSFFNFLPLFAVIPFGIVLITKDYDVSNVIVWMLTMLVITLISNFLNFIFESISAEIELSFLPIIVTVGGLFVEDLNIFHIRVNTKRQVGRQCPWGGRPCHKGNILFSDNGETDHDGRIADVLVVETSLKVG